MKLAPAVVALALGLAGSAQAATTWRVSGSLKGTYQNAVTWDNCPVTGAIASFAENATVDARLRASGRLDTSMAVPGVVMHLTPSGSWTLTGSYRPRQQPPTGDIACGAPVAVNCGGPVVRGDPNSDRAVLFAVPAGRSYRLGFHGFPGVVESAAITPPPDQPLCGGGGADDTIALPLLGLLSSNIAPNAYNQTLTVRRSKFRGSRAFAVSATGTPDPCGDFYASCTQSGSLTLTLSFVPARG